MSPAYARTRACQRDYGYDVLVCGVLKPSLIHGHTRHDFFPKGGTDKCTSSRESGLYLVHERDTLHRCDFRTCVFPLVALYDNISMPILG